MKAAFITAIALFGSAALAQPRHAKNRRHAHAGQHEKRDIVWVTETDIVTEIIDITSTVWVDADATTPPSVAQTSTSATTTDAKFYTATTSTTPTPETVKPSTTFVSVFVAPVPASSSSVYVAPPVVPTTSSSVYVAPAPTTSTSVYVAPVIPTTTAEPIATSVAPVAVAITPTTKAAAAAATTPAASTGSSSSSYTGTCSSASKCDGDITFYDTGLGACGWDNDGTIENVVALPAGLMGSQSNGNPFCGMTITISKGGKTTTAKVVDKCPGCSGNAIDLSKKAFLDLADESVGRTDAVWWFN